MSGLRLRLLYFPVFITNERGFSVLGKCPLPSLIWQDWHALALYKGPNPSEEVVEDGEATQIFLKNALPIKKSCRCSKDKFLKWCEKAFFPILSTVPAPPDKASDLSAFKKLLVKEVTFLTFSLSISVKSSLT